MRWPIFAIFAYVALALDQSVNVLLHIPTRWGPVSPEFVLILAAFIGLWAPPNAVLWGCFLMGLFVDLNPAYPGTGGANLQVIVGPAALGYLFGGYAMVQFRGLLHRDSPLAIGALTFASGLFIHLVIMAVLVLHGLIQKPLPGWDPPDQLVYRFFTLLYTAVAAVPVAWLLVRTQWLWGFDTSRSGFIARRG